MRLSVADEGAKRGEARNGGGIQGRCVCVWGGEMVDGLRWEEKIPLYFPYSVLNTKQDTRHLQDSCVGIVELQSCD